MRFFTEQAAEFLRVLSKSRKQPLVDINFEFLVRYDLAELFPTEVQGIPIKLVFETAELIGIAFDTDANIDFIAEYEIFKELRFGWEDVITEEIGRVFDKE